MKKIINAFKLNEILKLFSLTILLLSTISCVKDDDYSIPPLDCTGLTTTLSIKDLILLVDQSTEINNLIVFKDENILEGYVITSDQSGNLYKTISIQDDLNNPLSKGLQIEIDANSLYTQYPIGSKIQIQLNGLVAGYDRGVVKIGSTYNQNGEIRVGRMSKSLADSNLKKTCSNTEILNPRVFNSIGDALKPNNVNTLIVIKNVQFLTPEVDLTFGDAVGLTTVNRKLVDKRGRTVDLRNSGYSDWANDKLPVGSGEITALVSIYNSTYQLYISDVNDVKFVNDRFIPGQAEPPSANAKQLFAGSDFNDWNLFLSSKNNTAIDLIVKHGIGNGLNSSDALHLKGSKSLNGAVFTVRATGENIPTNPSKIHFWLKGKSDKSLNIYLYRTQLNARGQQLHYAFNVRELTQNKLILENNGGSNSYIGKIDTGDKWLYVELNIEGLSDVNFKDDKLNLISFRLGNNAEYDLLIDDISLE